ncbi:hypothetical protein ACFSQP_08515 [Bizionia sediminis]|uniref:TonB-dependent receptor n=1 Tax=Bizionia sediminis TaxID=1737064 RepID=A0ABW5KSI6_9FLAO
MVTDSLNNPIEGAAVVLFKKKQKSFLNSTTTNNLGKYYFELNNPDETIEIQVNAIFYETKIDSLLFNYKSAIFKNFKLISKTQNLDEVLIKTSKSIRNKNDTILIKVDSYLKREDRTVEDLLKNIPGVIVKEDGQIEINGKSINTILVEGDNMFDLDYKVLSKNLNPKILDEIEIINNYNENSILKTLSTSNNTAINLKLKDDAKNQWIGEADIALSTDRNYNLTISELLIKKKNKFYATFKGNSLGVLYENTIGNFAIKDNLNSTQNLTLINNQTIFKPNFLTNANFYDNESLIFTASDLIALSKQLKLSFNLGYAKDKYTLDYKENVVYVDLDSTNLNTISEYSNGNSVGYVNLKLEYKTDTDYLETKIQVNRNEFEDLDSGFLQNSSFLRTFSLNSTSLNSKIEYSKKLKNNKIFSLHAYFKSDDSDDNYNINSSGEDVYNLEQFINDKDKHVFSKASLLFNKNLNVFLKYESRTRQLNGTNNFNNYLNENVQFLDGSSFKYNLVEVGIINQFRISRRINFKTELELTNGILTNLNTSKNINWFLNYKFDLNYNSKTFGKFKLKHQRKMQPFDPNNFIENYYLSGGMDFIKGVNNLNYTTLNSTSFEYNYSFWEKMTHFNLLLNYIETKDDLNLSSLIISPFVFNSVINQGDTNKYLSYIFKVDKRVKKLKGAINFSLNGRLAKSELIINAINNDRLVAYNMLSLKYTSILEKRFNIMSKVELERINFMLNSNQVTNINRLNFFVSPSYKYKKFTFNIELNPVFKSKSNALDKNYVFTNIKLQYFYDRFSFSIIAQNLFNYKSIVVKNIGLNNSNQQTFHINQRFFSIQAGFSF